MHFALHLWCALCLFSPLIFSHLLDNCPLPTYMNLNLITEEQAASLNAFIDNANNIILCCHKSPDGDAIGSMLGFAEFLRIKGKSPMIVAPDAYPDFLRWMPGNERIVRYDKHKEDVEAAFQKADLVVCLDFNATKRVLDMQETLENTKADIVVIDHHEQPEINANLIISYPQMCSTCEIVFRIIWQMQQFDAFSRNGAICLYTGMMTDTGGFTYNASRAEIYLIIGELLTKKFDKDKIYRNVYNNYSEWCIKMRGYVLSQKLTVIPGSHACYYILTKEEMKRYHFMKGDAEGLVNEPLRIKGMRLSISVREDTERENTFWVSLRSVDQYYCNKLAEEFFNGGGHLNAAGGRINGTLEDAEQIIHRAILAFAKRNEKN